MSSLSTQPENASAYEQAIRRLVERVNYEKIGHATYTDDNYRLDRMRKLLGMLDDPHLAAPVIHIAGTKGKGSTATFLSRMLADSGFRTGLYTSPHLIRLEERFQVDNLPCSPSELVEISELAEAAALRLEANGGGRATFFELTTAMAFLHFARRKAQVIVLEVGLGGRLDSTNVCQPIVSIITSIGLDHMAQLGNTIDKIASEKAGIIKPGVPVITTARHPIARDIISAVAKRHSAPHRMIEADFQCLWQALPLTEGYRLDDVGPAMELSSGLRRGPTAACEYIPKYPDSFLGPSTWKLAMLGGHQADNLAAALATIDQLSILGWSFRRASLADTVAQTHVRARMQIVGHSPWRIIDTAHNPDSIAATLNALEVHFPGQAQTIVFATSRDKDVETMLKMLFRQNRKIVLTQYRNNPRGLPLEDLKKLAQPFAVRPELCQTANSPKEAWRIVAEMAVVGEVICATGSFFHAAELLG